MKRVIGMAWLVLGVIAISQAAAQEIAGQPRGNLQQ